MSSEFTAVTFVVTLTITFGVTITVTAASLLACLLAWLACLAGLQRSLAQLKNYQSEKKVQNKLTPQKNWLCQHLEEAGHLQHQRGSFRDLGQGLHDHEEFS